VFNEILKSWKDEQKVFNTVEAAQDHIAKKIAPQASRIMVVERSHRYVLGF
jgi:hypothetical protein